MRWKIIHLLTLVLAVAIILMIYRSLWGPTWLNAKIVFGAYLVLLCTASVAAYSSLPEWRRIWIGYALFEWSWLAFFLHSYLGMVPDAYAPNLIQFCLLGIGLGVLCAILCHFLPGMQKDE